MSDLMKLLEEVYGGVNQAEVEAQEDFDSKPMPLDGDYKAEIKEFKLIEMSEDNSFFSLNMQVVETVKGIDGGNRYLSKTFNNGETQYATAAEAMEKLIKNLKTIGINPGTTFSQLVANCEASVGTIVCVKARPNKDNETKECKRDGRGWPKHIVTIVKEFKGVDPIGATPAATSSNAPF